ncbi:MAG: hypothetical protein EOO14_01375 [Chitinophagaceae bacterium]|nr:MAG: hypothetical protein EOO14_01375 [Chitinophagaceae bacterium]
MVVQKDHLLLQFLQLRLVVNGMHIYHLRKNRPILVTMPANPSRIVVTDGFHITRPMELRYRQQVAHFAVACAVNNDVLVGGAIFMLMFFAMGATSGMFVLQLFSLLPIATMLFLYYIKRQEFIQVRPA